MAATAQGATAGSECEVIATITAAVKSCSFTPPSTVIPANAGIQKTTLKQGVSLSWIPVFTGMTGLGDLGVKP